MDIYLMTVFVIFITNPCALSLEGKWINKVKKSNCNTNLANPIGESIMPLSASIHCPPWYYISEDGSNCVTGKSVGNTISINHATMQVSLKYFSCMTKANDSNVTVLGGCLFNQIEGNWDAIPLPCNTSELDDYMCAGLNREGQLCGRCKNRFAPAVYSYSLQCVPCKSHYLNWIIYAAIAFGPLTVLCLFLMLCHISPSSSYLHGLVLFSQTITLPFLMRMYLIHNESMNSAGITFMFITMSIFDVWNFNIFRLLYSPFCLHPNMTILQSLALDYLIAFYPLFLLFLVYTSIQLYSRNFKPIVCLWMLIRPVILCCRSFLNIETSLIQSFATIFFLSSLKLQSVSLDLLAPTLIYYNHGAPPTKVFLYLSGNVEYFGSEHLPYGIFAICILAAFGLFPAMLMFLYPCACFQWLLNKLCLNSLTLRTFMDAYQGMYKDGTNNTRDYRYFSGVFFIMRATLIVTLTFMNSYFFFNILCLVWIGVTVSIALFHPQKSHFAYIMDCLFTSGLAVASLLSISPLKYPESNVTSVLYVFVVIAVLAVFCYIAFLVLILLVQKARLPQRFLYWIKQKYQSTPLNPYSQYSLLT